MKTKKINIDHCVNILLECKKLKYWVLRFFQPSGFSSQSNQGECPVFILFAKGAPSGGVEEWKRVFMPFMNFH